MIYWISNVVLLTGLIVVWYRSLRGEYRATFLPGLGVRLLAAIGIGALYQYYYPAGDTFSLFDQACQLTEASRQDPAAFFQFLVNGSAKLGLDASQPRSIFFVWVLAFLNFGTGSSYWLDAMWLSVFSFAGTWYLVRKLIIVYPDARMIASLAFLFIPSVVVWGSGVMKETLALGALCFVAGVFLFVIKRRKLRATDFAWLALALLIVVNLKYYWAAVFLPAMATSLILHFWPRQEEWSSSRLAITWLSIFAVFCIIGTQLHPNFYFSNFAAVIQENHDAFIRFAPQSLYIHYFEMEADGWSLLINAPWALVSGIFRPFLFEARSVLHVLSGIENLLLLVLFLFQLSKIKWPAPEDRLLFLSVMAYILVLCIFLALSTPNFGTLSRYRIGFLPFLVFVLMMNSDVLRGRSFRKIIRRLSHTR